MTTVHYILLVVDSLHRFLTIPLALTCPGRWRSA